VKQWKKGQERVVEKEELSMAMFLRHCKMNDTIEELQKKSRLRVCLEVDYFLVVSQIL
jgi:hypothetical protein